MNGAPLQQEGGVGRAHHRHGIRDQHKPIVTFAAQRDLERHRIDVQTVNDDAAPGVLAVQGRADHTGLARRQ